MFKTLSAKYYEKKETKTTKKSLRKIQKSF